MAESPSVKPARISVEQAQSLAGQIRQRIERCHGHLGGVRLLRAVVFGSTVRDPREPDSTFEAVGALDLAVELQVESAAVRARVAAVPDAFKWQGALRLSGWEKALRPDDTPSVVLASLATVLVKANRRLYQRSDAMDSSLARRVPVLLSLWSSTGAVDAPLYLPLLAREPEPELGPVSKQALTTLRYLEAATLRNHARARVLQAKLRA